MKILWLLGARTEAKRRLSLMGTGSELSLQPRGCYKRSSPRRERQGNFIAKQFKMQVMYSFGGDFVMSAQGPDMLVLTAMGP